MKKEDKFLCLIPAKLNSSSIKRKNLKKIKKKNLLQITISTAKKSIYLRDIFVSTESKIIAKIASKEKCKIIKRPKSLSSKKALGIDVIMHFAKKIKAELKNNNIYIVVLQVTSPMRLTKHIDDSIKLLLKTKSNALISVKLNKIKIYKDAIIQKNKLKFLFKKRLLKNRQSLPKTYVPNGAIFIFNLKKILQNKNYFMKNSIPFVMDQKSSIDIDNSDDLKMARKLYSSK